MNKRFLLCLTLGAALMSCGGKTPDEPNPGGGDKPQPDQPVVTVDDKFGVKGADVLDYYKKALTDGKGEYTTSTPLDMGSYADAKDYVWQIWSTAVSVAESEQLPRMVRNGQIADWASISSPTDSWKVPEGGMWFFYAAKGAKPAAGYPLFMHLHGSSSDSFAEWQVSAAWAQYFKDSPSAYFIPKSPQGGTGVRWYQPSKQAKWERLLRQAFVAGDVDPARVYFMGVSEGAYGSQRLGSFYADYLAGVGPIAGGELLMNCPPENLANTAFCLQTGEYDTAYGRKALTMKVRSYLEGLRGQHPGYYNHRVELQPDMGHGCDYTVTTPWLKGYKRNPSPKYVAWENYGMGGINGEPKRFREGFHNLRVLEASDDRSRDDVRTFYEEKIADNVVDLSVRLVTITTTDPQNPGTGVMNMGVQKVYDPATRGRVRIYLNADLVDLSKPVVVRVNGREAFNGKLQPDMRHMVESCRFYFDPLRLYPAAVDVEVK